MKKTLFVSDLHIDASQPEIAAPFIDFLEHKAQDAEALYILGDLFEVWLGDDDPDPHKRTVIEALARLTATGVRCAVMHGNRDFLIGDRFCAQTGCRVVPEGTVLTLLGEPTLLMHGDSLCTDDTGYQRLRRIVRSPLVLWLLDRMSLAQRDTLARRLRGRQPGTRRTNCSGDHGRQRGRSARGTAARERAQAHPNNPEKAGADHYCGWENHT